MGTYSYDDYDDYNDYSRKSANVYRAEIEGRFNQLRNDIKHSDVTRDAQMLINRGVRKAFRDEDGYIEEAYNIKVGAEIISGLAFGLALSVVSVAQEAIHNQAIVSAAERSENEYYKEIKSTEKEMTERQEQSLSELRKQVEEQSERLGVLNTAYSNEYNEIKQSANETKHAAEQEYEKSKKQLDLETALSDKTYRESMEAERKRLDDAVEVKNRTIQDSANQRDREIAAANDRYDAEKRRIESEFSGAEKARELQNAQSVRDNYIDRANASHDVNISRADSILHSAEEASRQKMESISQKHSEEISDISKRREDATNQRASIIKREDDRIGTAYYNYTLKTQTEQSSFTNAQVRLANFEKAKMNDDQIHQKAVASVEPNAAMNYLNQGLFVRGMAGAGAYAVAFEKNHLLLGEEILKTVGSDKEKELIQKVSTDLANKVDAERNGRTHTYTTTEEERNQADQLVRKYAGDVSSEKALKDTIRSYDNTISSLGKQKQELDKLIKEKIQQLDATKREVEKTEKTLKQINDDKKALKTGKNEKGENLTAEQRKAIVERLQKNGDSAVVAKNLTNLVMKKNREENELNRLKEKGNLATSTLNRIQKHRQELNKDGKTIVDTVKRNQSRDTKKRMSWTDIKLKDDKKLLKENTIFFDKFKRNGESKSASKAQQRATATIMKSINRLKREMARELNKGNDFHRELMGNIRKMDQMGRKYNVAVNVAKIVPMTIILAPGFAVKAMGRTFKVMGLDQTRVGQKIKAFTKGHGATIGKVFKKGGKLANNVLSVPTKILKAPLAISRAPGTLLQKTVSASFRTTRRVAGTAVGGSLYLSKKLAKGTGKIVGKGMNKAFGRTKWYQKATERFRLARERISSLKLPHPINALKKKIKHIIAAIAGAIVSAIAAIVTAFMLILVAFFLIFFLFIVILLLLAALTSVLGTISGWIESFSAENNALIKNNPNYIMNQAVNYRNAELDIAELFYRENNGEIEIKVNDSPIYYALYDEGFHWLWWDGNKELSSINEAAYNLYIKLAEEHRSGTSFMPDDFASEIDGYEKVYFNYYDASQLKTDANGDPVVGQRGNSTQYILKDNAVASNYELSNAKDALALVDSLYTSKTETMQRVEVLAYLGIGDYQLMDKENQIITNNLFWATHNFIYNSGNMEEDIWYHVTDENGNVNHGKRYVKNNDGDYGIENAPRVCGNYGTNTIEWTETSTVSTSEHTSLDNLELDAYGEYDASMALKTSNQTANSITASQLYYYMSSMDYAKSGKESFSGSSSSAIREAIVDYAVSFVGKLDYVYGGTSLVTGADCSGFIQSIYKKFGIYLPRTSGEQGKAGKTVTIDEAQAGDIVHYDGHVAIYMGDGRVVHASSPKDDVKISNKWNYRAVKSIRNVIDSSSASTSNRCNLTVNNGEKVIQVYKIKENTVSTNYTTTWHNLSSSNCSRLNFYKDSGSNYYVVDKAGNLIDRISITKSGKYGALYDAITTGITINGEKISVNKSGADSINLNYFYLTWDSNNNGYDFYVVGSTNITGSTNKDNAKKSLNGSIVNEENNISSVKYNFKGFDKNSIKIRGCSHQHEGVTEMNYNMPIRYCKGHIDLDVDFVVSTIGDETTDDKDQLFFKAAANLPIREEHNAVNAFGLITLDGANDTFGLGVTEYFAFNPSEDWGEDSDLRGLAQAKMESDITYELSQEQNAQDVAMDIKHFFGGLFKSTVSSPEDTLLFGMQFAGKYFYTESFVSGEQKDLTVYKYTPSDGLIQPPVELNIQVVGDGAPTPYVKN